MAKVRVDLDHAVFDGSELVFIAPADASEVEGLIIYYPTADGEQSSSFVFKDAHGSVLTNIDNLFKQGAYVKVILNTTDEVAYIQNADTNSYLEGELYKVGCIIRGEGENSCVSGASNEAVSDNSIALGSNNVSGTKSFTINAMSQDSEGYLLLTLDNTNDIKVNQECRFKINAEYYAKIKGVDSNSICLDVLANKIYDKELYTPRNGEYADDNNPHIVRYADGSDTEKNSVFIIGEPNIGTDRILGNGASSFGINNQSPASGSFSAGVNNKAVGGFAFVLGNDNIAAYSSLVAGRGNEARFAEYGVVLGHSHNIIDYSRYCFVAGEKNIVSGAYTSALGGSNKALATGCTVFGIANEANGLYSIAGGYYTITNSPSQVALGSGNELVPDALFMLGNGQKNSSGNMVRSNAFVVYKNGDAIVSKSFTAKDKISANSVWADLFTGNNSNIALISSSNTVTNKYGLVGGYNSKCYSYGGIALGIMSVAGTEDNKTNTDMASDKNPVCAVALGFGNTASHRDTLVAGRSNSTKANYQTIVGAIADPSEDSLFTVGNNTTLSRDSGGTLIRSNALDVKKSGKALLGSADILDDEKSIVTKKYADTKADYEEGTWTPTLMYSIAMDGTNYAEGVIVKGTGTYHRIGRSVRLIGTIRCDSAFHQKMQPYYSGYYFTRIPFIPNSTYMGTALLKVEPQGSTKNAIVRVISNSSSFAVYGHDGFFFHNIIEEDDYNLLEIDITYYI